MAQQDLTGKWAGQYVYGKSYEHESGEHRTGKSVSFEIEFNCTEDGLLSGYCTDDKFRVHSDKPAILEGYIEGGRIFFVKRYPHAFFINEQGESEIEPGQPSHEIHYTGYGNKNYFAGKWDISHMWQGEGGLYYESNGEGTWFIERVKPDADRVSLSQWFQQIIKRFFKNHP
jgi:hypothetical protein